MTTAEAFIALQIGCSIQIEHWEAKASSYYFLDGQNFMYRGVEPDLGLDFTAIVCTKDEILEGFPNQRWRLYDDTASTTGDEDRMQNQS